MYLNFEETYFYMEKQVILIIKKRNEKRYDREFSGKLLNSYRDQLLMLNFQTCEYK